MSPGDSVMLYNGACLYSRLGETRRAIDTLRQAVAAGVTNFGWMKHDPTSIRSATTRNSSS